MRPALRAASARSGSCPRCSPHLPRGSRWQPWSGPC